MSGIVKLYKVVDIKTNEIVLEKVMAKDIADYFSYSHRGIYDVIKNGRVFRRKYIAQPTHYAYWYAERGGICHEAMNFEKLAEKCGESPKNMYVNGYSIGWDFKGWKVERKWREFDGNGTMGAPN